MQASKRSDAANRDGDGTRHPRQDSTINQDAAARHFSNLDQLSRALVAPAAPTEPQVTDVTPGSTVDVRIGEDEGVIAGMLGEPALRLFVEPDDT